MIVRSEKVMLFTISFELSLGAMSFDPSSWKLQSNNPPFPFDPHPPCLVGFATVVQCDVQGSLTSRATEVHFGLLCASQYMLSSEHVDTQLSAVMKRSMVFVTSSMLVYSVPYAGLS